MNEQLDDMKHAFQAGVDEAFDRMVILRQHRYRNAISLVADRTVVISNVADYGYKIGIGVDTWVFGTDPEEVTVSHPLTWWDAVKHRFRWICWFPFVDRPEFKTTTMRKYAVYPTLKTDDPPGEHICISRLKVDSSVGIEKARR